jgi:hypothetical protein
MKCTTVGRIPDGKPCENEAVGTNMFGHPNCAKCLADVQRIAGGIRELARRCGDPDILPEHADHRNN